MSTAREIIAEAENQGGTDSWLIIYEIASVPIWKYG